MANGNFLGGTGDLDDPYLIEDSHDLNAIRSNLTAHYKLVSDINLNVSPYNTGTGWVEIGMSTSPFTGTFDGNGRYIDGLYTNFPNKDSHGLFGTVSGGIIKNVNLININLSGATYVGGLVSAMINSAIVENSFVSGVIVSSKSGHTGGIVGIMTKDSTIKNSYTNVNIKSNLVYTGGLIGFGDGTIKVYNSYAIGEILVDTYTGGLVGYCPYTAIFENCYWDKETTNQTKSTKGIGKTTLEMKTKSTFSNWENAKLDSGRNIWSIVDGEYPLLWFQVKPLNKTLILQQDNYKTFDGESWNTISEPLSAEVFLNKGMDSSIFERKVQNLPPQPLIDKTSILFTNGEVGKVFSKTVDLGKYMDLRSIKVE